MTQRFHTVAAFLTGAILTFGASAVAGPIAHGPGFFRILRDLDLTEEQKALGQELIEAAKADREAAKADRDRHFETITTELGKARPDSAALHGVIDEALARGGEIAHARLDDFLALHATFDKDQREVLIDGLDQARELHQERMEGLRERIEAGGPPSLER